MTRRKMLLMTAGVLGFAALVGLANQNAVFAADEGNEALLKKFGDAKVSLQQGLASSIQEGQPISAKFEVDDGKLQLSIYTAKDGKFFEVLVDCTDGKVTKVEPITEGEDLAAARSQIAAMAKTKISLKEAVVKATAQSTDARAVSVVPGLKDGHPVASIVLLGDEKFKSVQQLLD